MPQQHQLPAAGGETGLRLNRIFWFKNGRKIPIEGRGSIILQDGKAVAMVGILRHITQRNRTENTLRPAYEKMKRELPSRHRS